MILDNYSDDLGSPDAADSENLTRWRRRLHAYPEVGFAEHDTAAFVGKILRALGWDVHTNIGGTGLVANLTAGSGQGVVGIRAEMDALRLTEVSGGKPYASRNPGKMHACGHDGHMAIVLGTAKLLSERRDFDGTVRLIFQPAEETGRGASAMINDGLFERYPVDEIYGLHNIPGFPSGSISTRAGGIMAGEDNFEIRVRGVGSHAARPHLGIDPLVIGAQIVLALQTIVSRTLDSGIQAVVSCTEFVTDGVRNAIPENVLIKGDTRSFDPEVQAMMEARIRQICAGICEAYGATCEVVYTHEVVPTVNWGDYLPAVIDAAVAIAGVDRVEANVSPLMISEDFGMFLTRKPGVFVFLGNGANNEAGSISLHNSSYDFNDENLTIGAQFFAQVVRNRLPAK